jgi:uncharacterized iron-regulated protein
MRTLAALLVCAALAGCAQDLLHAGHPLSGKVWDTRAGTFIAHDELWRRAAPVRHVLVGEVHDNPEHHRVQRIALEALATAGPRRSLAMEQFDSEHQAALDAAAPRDAEAAADAGRFDRKGWNWPLYQQLVAFALENRMPLLAANLSRAEARRIMANPALATGLPEARAEVIAGLERDMVEGHCGHQVDARLAAAMVTAQRARDARMAAVISGARTEGTVLLAGNAHVRRDRGVPLYLRDAGSLVIGLLEVRPGAEAPQDYLTGGFATPASYDYVWFTPRISREDPCAALPRTK